MQILYFYQYFTTPRGAWSARAFEFARRWVREGDSVTVITSVYDKSDLRPERFLDRQTVEGIEIRTINIRLSNKHGILQRLWTFAAYALIACWYALTLPCDVVVSSSGPITVGLPGLVARYLRGKRFIFEVRDLWPEGAIQLGILSNPAAIWLARAFEQTCYRAADQVVTLSEGMAEWIRQRYGVSHLQVVPNASDNDLFVRSRSTFARPAWADGKHVVIYAGTLGLIDDCGQILNMAGELERLGKSDPIVRSIEIAIVGDGKERAALEQRTLEMDLQNVRFAGLRPREEVMGWLSIATCALFVCKNLPFLNTASPNKLFDAFAAGLPVVQTSEGWIRNLLEREQCGLSVQPDDPAALADAVVRVVKDPSLREFLAGNAQRVGRDLFDRDLLTAKMRQVLASS